MSPLLAVVSRVLLWVTAMCVVAGVAVVGPRRLYAAADNLLPYLREARTEVATLLVVLLVSALGRDTLQTVSEVAGLRLTGAIYAIEGGFVAWLQSTFAGPRLTLFFSSVYVFGYTFLLVFPFIAYAALPESTTLKRVVVAYALNYAIGLVVYTAVLAYGPRNVMPDAVTSLLYTFEPNYQTLVAEVNENTNVFPSLHTSLSVTVALFAVRTREEYPGWTAIACPLAAGVVVATMYLGIHWLTDVIGGILLAIGCVALSFRFVEPAGTDGLSTIGGGGDGGTSPGEDDPGAPGCEEETAR